jgi:hypothetical protein
MNPGKYYLLKYTDARDPNELRMYDTAAERETATFEFIFGDDRMTQAQVEDWDRILAELNAAGRVSFKGGLGFEWFTAAPPSTPPSLLSETALELCLAMEAHPASATLTECSVLAAQLRQALKRYEQTREYHR